MKTIKEWIEEIPNDYIRKSALGYMDEGMASLNLDSLGMAISMSFKWDKTAEGHDFWSLVAREEYDVAMKLLGDKPMPSDAADPASDILQDALNVVTGARRNSYGTPEDNFSNIARLWNAYIEGIMWKRGSVTLNATDVAILMDLMKTARLIETPDHKDSWTDKAGYSACGYRCSIAKPLL